MKTLQPSFEAVKFRILTTLTVTNAALSNGGASVCKVLRCRNDGHCMPIINLTLQSPV